MRSGQLHENGGWRRVVLEKPFGTDLASAVTLNKQVHKALNENQIYRIDHYLGKETVQNILFTRFANTIFEPIWNRTYIDHVQITVAEKVGVGHRAGFYDSVGVLRDMFQNHLLQLLTLVAMEPSASFNASDLRNEKVKVLSAIQPITPEQVSANTVRAQYKGYRSEAGGQSKFHHTNLRRDASLHQQLALEGRAVLFAFGKKSRRKTIADHHPVQRTAACHVPDADHETEHARALPAARRRLACPL